MAVSMSGKNANKSKSKAKAPYNEKRNANLADKAAGKAKKKFPDFLKKKGK
jgi:hypothetical protein